jgi:hypothetical protein
MESTVMLRNVMSEQSGKQRQPRPFVSLLPPLPLTSQSAATSIRGISVLVVGPSLEVDLGTPCQSIQFDSSQGRLCAYGVERIFEIHIFYREPLHGFELVVKLANAAECNARAVMAFRVVDANVGAVSFEGDAVVAIVDCPPPKVDVRRPDRVGAVVVDLGRATC